MRVLALQFTVSVLSLIFGLTALGVARRIKASPMHSAGWRLTGTGFTLVSVNWVLQNVFASVAFLSGAGSPAWDCYLAYAAVFDHSRTVALIALFALMLRLQPLETEPTTRDWPVAVGGVLAGMTIGGVFGWVQSADIVPQYYSMTHYPVVAILDVIELLVVLCALFFLLIRERVDRILWTVLSVYAFYLALNAVWASGMISIDSPGAWAASPLLMHGYRALLMGLMLSLTIRRGILAKKGLSVSGLLDSARPAQPAVPK